MKLFGHGEGAYGFSAAAVRGVAVRMGLLVVLGAAGCASPGPPRAPSLRLPEPVSDLAARREGDVVELRFTAPWRSTDKLPLRMGTENGVLCRAVQGQGCVTVAGFSGKTTIATAGPGGGRNMVTWRDALPVQLTSGPRLLLSYRVEFFNRSGRSAGKSEAAYSVAGPTPVAVEDLRAGGSRLGVILSWRADPAGAGEVVLERETLVAEKLVSAGTPEGTAVREAGSTPQPPPESPRVRTSGAHRDGAPRPAAAERGAAANVVWLRANGAGDTAAATAGGGGNAGQTLDTTGEPDVAYRYTAWRSLTVKLGGRSIELRSAQSNAVEYTLRESYPPAAPTGLSAAGFFAPGGATATATPGSSAGYAVDLIWAPVDEAGLIAGFGGYNIYRAKQEGGAGVEGAGVEGAGGRTRLNQAPVALPAYRDSSADPADGYRYFVTAVDAKGNESEAATVMLAPAQ
jgi:hypothetical protein